MKEQTFEEILNGIPIETEKALLENSASDNV